MEVVKNNDGTYKIEFKYRVGLRASFEGEHDFRKSLESERLDHIELAKKIAQKGYKTLKVITVADRLDDPLWDDPIYMHKNNFIIVSRAVEEARNELMNRYYSSEKLKEIKEKHSFPTVRTNYKEESGRDFNYELDDALFNYQEQVKVFRILSRYFADCIYEQDDEGFLVEDADGNPILEKDDLKVVMQKDRMLEQLLMPRVSTKYDRVYNMPSPFNRWDNRSNWHQAFYIEVPEEGVVVAKLGNGGSSGSRETNGLWAHTFAELAATHGYETPTWLMRYDSKNVWFPEFRLDTYATLNYDLGGNYGSPYQTIRKLFKGRRWHLNRTTFDKPTKYEFLD